MHAAKAILLEACLVTLLGVAFALLANTLSPLGLKLNRDYFPRGEVPPTLRPAITTAPGPLSAEDARLVVQRLQTRGLQAIGSKEVAELFRDPRYADGLIVFVDSREESPYQAGHIPGAWPFDHYRPERYLGSVLPVCMTALQIVVYCQGGSCEDSEFAAVNLRDAGIPTTSLFVFVGGLDEWSSQGRPVETGIRGSGEFQPASR